MTTAAFILWRLRIRHDYFRKGAVEGITVCLSAESRLILSRRGLLWRETGIGEWSLVSLDGNDLDNSDRIEVELRLKDKMLTYITDWDWSLSGECYQLEVTGEDRVVEMRTHPGIKIKSGHQAMFRLVFSMGNANKGLLPCSIELVFCSFHKYWEYVFVPRDDNASRTLRLEETKQMISFGECQPMEFMGRPVLQCRSTEKIKMEDRPDYTLRLWEHFPMGKRELLRGIPFPRPGMFLDVPDDTLRQVVYI